MGGNLPKPQSILLLLLTAASFFHLSQAFFDLFPMVNVTFINESNHSVQLVCDAVEVRYKVFVMAPGGEVWWTIRDVLFPLVWCYVEINRDVWGVFWGYQSKARCFGHCDWRFRDTGLWLVSHHEHEEDQIYLNKNGGGF